MVSTVTVGLQRFFCVVAYELPSCWAFSLCYIMKKLYILLLYTKIYRFVVLQFLVWHLLAYAYNCVSLYCIHVLLCCRHLLIYCCVLLRSRAPSYIYWGAADSLVRGRGVRPEQHWSQDIYTTRILDFLIINQYWALAYGSMSTLEPRYISLGFMLSSQ